MKTKLHLSLNVNDVETSTLWYATFFARPPHKVRDGYANFDLDNPALKLALNARTAESRGPLNHLGILVEDSAMVESERERLEAAGLVARREDGVLCCHARQDKFWVSDPDGNAWEIYSITDDQPEDPPKAEAGNCCATLAVAEATTEATTCGCGGSC